MATKRKSANRRPLFQSKQVKMSTDVELTSETVNTVLPILSGAEFDEYMKKQGPKAWKKATDTLSLEDAKRLLCMVLCRSSWCNHLKCT